MLILQDYPNNILFSAAKNMFLTGKTKRETFYDHELKFTKHVKVICVITKHHYELFLYK